MDFRKADPDYVNFKPTTATEAIDLFHRHKRLGVPPHLWPEVFVKCAVDLKGEELDKFESYLINPEGEPTGTLLTDVDIAENEKLRKKLLSEATRRDMEVVDEDGREDDEKVQEPLPEQPPSEDTLTDDFAELSTEAVMDFEMINQA